MTDEAIIVASAHVLDGPLRLGSAHLARCFAENGYRTLYLNAPTSPFHLIHPSARAAAARRRQALQLRLTAIAGLSELTPFALVPHHNTPLLRAASTLASWPDRTSPSIVEAIGRAGFGAAKAVLFDSVMFWPLIQRLGLPSVYRVADRINGFAGNSAAMIALHRTVLREADLVIVTAAELTPTAAERSKPSKLVSNGVPFALFAEPAPRPVEYQGMNQKIALYAGAIEDWFDVEAFSDAVRRLPEVSFVLISPDARRLGDTLGAPNVHDLGARAYDALPGYFQHADVGLIPFDLTRHRAMLDAVCPLKLFEYLAAGLPVVSYAGREISRLEPPVRFYDSDGRAFTDQVQRALADPTDAPARQAFARGADWRQRFDDLRAAMREIGLLAAG